MKYSVNKPSSVISTFIFFLVFLNITCKAQYVQFPDSNSIWRETRAYSPQPPDWESWDYQNYLGNVLFNDGITKIVEIHQNGIHEGSTNGNYFNIYYDNLVGWLQQDTSKKIYLADQGVLLYDFELKVGDTLPESYVNVNTSIYDTEVITSIDSIYDGLIYRKRYNFKTIGFNHQLGSIIEGIGSSFGLLNSIKESNMNESSSLNCFRVENRTVYPDTIQICDIITKVHSLQAKPYYNVAVYPNPVSDFMQISMPGNHSDDIVHVYDISGKLVLNSKIEGGKLSVQFLENGIYFIRGKELTGRFVKRSQ